MSKVAAAITSPVTNAAKQENSTKSLRSIRIRAPSPWLRGLRLAFKGWIMAKARIVLEAAPARGSRRPERIVSGSSHSRAFAPSVRSLQANRADNADKPRQGGPSGGACFTAVPYQKDTHDCGEPNIGFGSLSVGAAEAES
jgi:hypothetical protein